MKEKRSWNWHALFAWSFIPGIWVVVFGTIVLLMVGCASPKIIEQHHHHSKEVDTLAVEAMIDNKTSSWHDEMMANVRQMMEQSFSEQSSQEQEQERITETMTTYVDSLGREVRQQQRTTERNISRQQQQREEQLKAEYTEVLRQAISRQDSIWQQRLDILKTHWEEADSTSNSVQPAPEDNRPWYKRWASNILLVLIGSAVVAVGLFIERRRTDK